MINAGDTLSFAIGDLPPSASSTAVNPTVVSDLPLHAPFPLVNTIIATATNADPLESADRHGFRDRKPPCRPGSPVESANRLFTYERHHLVRKTKHSFNVDAYCCGILLPDSVINAGDTLSFAIGDLLPSSSTISVNPTVVTNALHAVPAGEHDHRDGRQRRSAEPNVRVTRFSADRKPFGQRPRRSIFRGVKTDSFTVDGTTRPGSPKKTKLIPINYSPNTGTLTATNVLLRDVLPDWC